MARNGAIDTHSALRKERENYKAKQDLHKTRIETRCGQHVCKYRMKRHFTQAQLAFLCGVNQNYISEIEHGKRNLTLRVLENIAEALGVNAEELIK